MKAVNQLKGLAGQNGYCWIIVYSIWQEFHTGYPRPKDFPWTFAQGLIDAEALACSENGKAPADSKMLSMSKAPSDFDFVFDCDFDFDID